MNAKDRLHGEFYDAVRDADRAGRRAVEAMTPVPMVVGTPRDPVGSLLGRDDGGLDPAKPTYFVADGVCGFAWVTVRSEKGPDGAVSRKFENWLKGRVQTKFTAREAFHAGPGERGWYERGNSVVNPPSTGYYGGTEVWVGGFNQSMQKKEAYARAFAAVISERIEGCSAYAGSRMD